MARLAGKLQAIVVRDFVTDLSYRLTFAMELVDGALLVLSYSFLARIFGATRPDGYPALDFLIVGIAASSGFGTALLCFAQGVRGTQATGTIKAVMATPTSATTFVLLSSAYPILRSLIDVAMLLGAGALLGLTLSSANIPGAALVMGLGLLAMAAFGILSAAFAIVFKRGDPVTWLLATVTWLLSGVLYPTAVLPAPLARLSWWLPTTHALSALRALIIDGAAIGAVSSHVVFLAGFAAVGVPASVWIFGRAVRHAKRVGTLGHV